MALRSNRKGARVATSRSPFFLLQFTVAQAQTIRWFIFQECHTVTVNTCQRVEFSISTFMTGRKSLLGKERNKLLKFVQKTYEISYLVAWYKKIFPPLISNTFLSTDSVRHAQSLNRIQNQHSRLEMHSNHLFFELEPNRTFKCWTWVEPNFKGWTSNEPNFSQKVKLTK